MRGGRVTVFGVELALCEHVFGLLLRDRGRLGLQGEARLLSVHNSQPNSRQVRLGLAREYEAAKERKQLEGRMQPAKSAERGRREKASALKRRKACGKETQTGCWFL